MGKISLYSKYPLLEESQEYINNKYDLEDIFEEDIIERAKETLLYCFEEEKATLLEEDNDLYSTTEVVLDDYKFDREILNYTLRRLIVSYINDNVLLDIYLEKETKTLREKVEKDDNIEKILNKLGIDIEKTEIGREKQVDKNKIDLEVKETDIEAYKIKLEDILIFYNKNEDYNISNQMIEDGFSYHPNVQDLYDIFEAICYEKMAKDLPYDTTNVQEKLEDIDLSKIKEELEEKKKLKYNEDNIDEDKILSALDHLNPDCEYERWRNIGFALADYYDDKERAKEIYKKWSSKGSKYDDKTEKYINKIIEEAGKKDKKITIGSLIYYAKENDFNFNPQDN